MNAQPEIRDLRAEADGGLIERVYHEILEPSFGPDELDTLEFALDGLMPGGSYECWGLCALDDEAPVGCILGYPYPDSGVLLIGYIAARPGMRSRGVGGLLMDEARRRWYDRPDITLVVAEIEDPRFHPSVGDIDLERRIAFYAAHGTQVIVGPYFQPRLEGEGKNRVYDLFLSVLPSGAEGVSPGDSMSARQVADFLLEYFADSGEDSDWPLDEDKEGRWLLDWYRGRETVGLYPIGGYREAEIPRVPGRP
jgi:GNAT superfamily N-acetyltransferase